MGYSKAETEKKQRKLVSKTQRNTRKVLVILFKVILVGIIAVIIAGAGAGFGMMKGILDTGYLQYQYRSAGIPVEYPVTGRHGRKRDLHDRFQPCLCIL